MNSINLKTALQHACEKGMAALRTIVTLVPAGGEGDKVSPPTHEKGQYAFETRVIDGRLNVDTVLLDSVQSQANRFEEALLDRISAGEINLPLMQIAFPNRETLTSLSVPHRVHDAIFRDSTCNGVRFRESEIGKAMVAARPWNAAAMFRLCPTALLFGAWDSQGKGGVNSAKFARALVSEIIAIDAVRGVRTSSRIDPLGIKSMPGIIFKGNAEQWTLDAEKAAKTGGKPVLYGAKTGSKGTPAEINHGNIPPTITNKDTGAGGVTFREARQTAVLSFAQLRKLHFPLNGKADLHVDIAGRAVVAAVGVYAIALQIDNGYQLRSRCQLIPADQPEFEWLGSTAAERRTEKISLEMAHEALVSLSEESQAMGLLMERTPIRLEPEAKLLKLLELSDKSVDAVEE